MDTEAARPQSMIETTDALEAVSACQCMKNFLFTLILIGMGLCQAVFWLNYFGLIKNKPCSRSQTKQSAQIQCEKETSAPVSLASVIENTGQNETAASNSRIAEMVEQMVNKVESGTLAKQEEDIRILLEKPTDMMPAELPAESASPAVTDPKPVQEPAPTPASQPPQQQTEKTDKAILKGEFAIHISGRFAGGLVAACNFVILAGAILYCLSLLMCVKISLAGRLGGINHIVRAFFISLFLLVVLIPWQVVLPKVLIGALWLPGELFCGGWIKTDNVIFWKVMLYLRFCGLWLIALWLLLWTQIRSAKWARATLRRLGVVR